MTGSVLRPKVFVDDNGELTPQARSAWDKITELFNSNKPGVLPPSFAYVPASATPNGIAYINSDGSITSTGAVLNGQILIGRTGFPPALGQITGTLNQITVTNGPASITLSLPQSIGTGSSPTFGGLSLSGLTANAFIFSGVGGSISSSTAPTNGQLLIGSTGLAPVAAALTGTASQIVVTNGPGAITFSLDAAITGGLTAITLDQQTASPTNGQTVVMTADNRDRMLWLTPAGVIASATITLPADATSRIGQVAMFGTSQQITALTVNGAGTIYNAPTTLLAGQLSELIKVSSNTWAKLS